MAAALVSSNYFDALGTRILLGRTFSDVRDTETPVVEPQAGYWTSTPGYRIGRATARSQRPPASRSSASLRPEFTGYGGFPGTCGCRSALMRHRKPGPSQGRISRGPSS